MSDALDSSSGRLKLPGVGRSFHTKLLYFAGCASGADLLPLILDQHTSRAYFVLLDPLRNESARDTFMWKRDKLLPQKYAGGPKVAGRKGYCRFVEDLNRWAGALGVPPAVLEAYLFGRPAGRPMTDPRARLALAYNAETVVPSS